MEKIGENPKLFWNYTRHFTRSSSTIDMIVDGEDKITDDTQKAEILNSYFTSVLIVEPEIKIPLPQAPNVGNVILDFDVTPEIVRDKLSKLKPNKASGPDNVSVNVLRNCLNFDLPLAIIFNQSLQMGQLPQDWRDANVTPLHKKGSRQLRSNYRPVSLTSQVVKLMERIVQVNILKIVLKNKTISCDQHGFQDGCSCVTQLLECIFDWTENFDNKLQTDIIYLDFAKAFDTVPHKRLIHKLKQAGIRGKVLRWVSAFLSNRRQRVILRNGSSSWQNVTSGVPQGSILGPLLFLIYVNDLPDSVRGTSKMFADDTKVYCPIQTLSDCERLQDDLNALSCWSNTWLLRFNAGKCVVVKTRQKIDYDYTLDGVNLTQVHEQKDLGVNISDTLLPSSHVQDIVKKANQRTGIVKRCFTGLENKIGLLYKSIIRPVLEYGAPAWNPWHKKDIDVLESSQRRCVKLAPNTNLGLESLEHRRMLTDLTETYKIVHGYYKNDYSHFFSKPGRNLRGHSCKLAKKSNRTDIAKNFFSNRVVNPWNNLPESVANAPSLSTFKKRLRSLPTGLEG